MRKSESQKDSIKDRISRFNNLLDVLESHLDNGFFISLVGKVVVDEKKIYSVLSELRALRFDLEHDLEGEIEGEKALHKVDEKFDSGEYAVEVLDNLEQTMQKMMIAVRDKKRMMTQRSGQEVKRNGAAEI